MWRWHRFKWWMGGVRHGATYKDALERIVGQGAAMQRDDAGVWAIELASNALQEHDASTTSPTPYLRETFNFYHQFLKQ